MNLLRFLPRGTVRPIHSRFGPSRILQLRGFYGSQNLKKPTLFQKVVNKAPAPVLPYLKLLRLDLPIGSYLLFWPCAWSLVVSTPFAEIPNLYYLFLFGCGSVLMRGAGCIVNDLWDRKIDKLVERTKDRPLASEAVSTKQALALLASQLGLALGVLLQFNWFSVFLGLCSVPLVVFYPSFKRFFALPQLVLGLTFNWGALMGFSVLHGYLEPMIVGPLYLAGVAWTLHYDTIYAHQDKADDIKVGIRSSALTFGDSTREWLCLFSITTHSLISLVGYELGLATPFYVGMAAAGAHLFWQIKTLDMDSREDCASKFRSNKWFGLIIFLAFLFGKDPEILQNLLLS